MIEKDDNDTEVKMGIKKMTWIKLVLFALAFIGVVGLSLIYEETLFDYSIDNLIPAIQKNEPKSN